MGIFRGLQCVLASAVGELCPLFEASAPVLRLVLDNVESKEITYVKDQFLVVRSKLDVLSSQVEDINCEIKKGRLDSQFFTVEENICNQFRKYIDILEAKPEYKEVRKRLFLQHFPKTGEKNLYMLYDAVMGNSTFGEPILDVVEQYEARNRRVLEDFCVRLNELLCLVVHAVSRHKDSFALSSFPEECHYWEKHKNVNLCVHSE
uniref:Uncharacterized protein n=1 Tax=Sinocyclocheilus anshuiensis TaxID=1608454 RepID=A0A671L741_9TELE